MVSPCGLVLVTRFECSLNLFTRFVCSLVLFTRFECSLGLRVISPNLRVTNYVLSCEPVCTKSLMGYRSSEEEGQDFYKVMEKNTRNECSFLRIKKWLN